METLLELKKKIVSDGRLSIDDVELLRVAMFNDDGMTKAKGDFYLN